MNTSVFTENVLSNPLPVGLLDAAITRLEAWLETMRGPGGYGGPVVHWWQQSLLYTGPGLDWRYEGIIAGYLTLWERSRERRWLEKARCAGDDLLQGQSENGHFLASCFEINPASGGTPHEAACDIGLLLLAGALKEIKDLSWEQYAACAERNLRAFYLEKLWDNAARGFRDDPRAPSFVPNKSATACEALFLLAELRGDDEWVTRYALPTLDRILLHQVSGGRMDGAIAQNSFGAKTVEKYFPIYIARCVPALLRGYEWTSDERFIEGALAAMRFIIRWGYEDGSFPTVVYANSHVNRYPAWIAPIGDVLRVAEALHPHGLEADLRATRERLLGGQDGSGGIQTATGFAAQAGGKVPALPDVRDLLHVTGWCDKVFRYLALHGSPSEMGGDAHHFEAACIFQDRTLHFHEDHSRVELRAGGKVCYLWTKGSLQPEVATPEFWLR